MTPEELEALLLAAVAKDRAQRWDYSKTLENGKLAEFLAQQVTDPNTLADVRSFLAALNDAGLLITDVKQAVINAAEEWRDASLFSGDSDLTIGERITRLDVAAPALQQAVDRLRGPVEVAAPADSAATEEEAAA